MSNVIDFQSFKEARIAREEKASQDAEDAVSADGRGHFLATYDGDEVEDAILNAITDFDDFVEDELMMDAELLLKEMEGLVDAYE
jgi:hypothetical protein